MLSGLFRYNKSQTQYRSDFFSILISNYFRKTLVYCYKSKEFNVLSQATLPDWSKNCELYLVKYFNPQLRFILQHFVCTKVSVV